MTAAPVTGKTLRAKKPASPTVKPVEPVEIDPDPEVRWGIYEITPDVARYWLTLNTQNPRNIAWGTVNDYKRDIEHNAWPLNFQPITFRKNGSLDNGQHRLEAVIAADKPIISMVVWGVDDDIYDTVDIGLKRSASQIIGVTYEKYAAFMASAAALIWRLEHEFAIRAITDNHFRPTMHDRLEVLAQHDEKGELFASVEYINARCTALRGFTGSVAVAHIIHYYGAKKHGKVAADRFFKVLNTGLSDDPAVPLSPHHPAYRLRETLMKIRREQQKIRQHHAYGLWLPAWNAYAQGDMLKKLVPLDFSQNPDLTIL